MSSKSQIRSDTKRNLKSFLKAPRNGKAFIESIYQLDEIYRELPNNYQKKYVKELTDQYYFKYYKRHKNREPLDMKKLLGGCMDCHCSMALTEGGLLPELKVAYDIYKGARGVPVVGDIIKRGEKAVSKKALSMLGFDDEKDTDTKKITTKRKEPSSTIRREHTKQKKEVVSDYDNLKLDNEELDELLRKLVITDDFKGRKSLITKKNKKRN